ncbi:Ribonuclease J 1 [Paenibacillus sp. P1XP2]|nr:Ribonuclease J 1 [Paenibacillus sp. P1XP2]
MAAIGEEGVLALLSDSTNAEKPGFTPSEKNVGLVLEDIFRKASQRVVIATFASNVHRIQQVVNAAESTGRKITVIGRSMVNVVSIAAELGYLHMPDGMLIEPEEVNKMAADRVVVLCTGSQGEPMSALTRMARSTHRKVDILPGDTVIIAATPVRQREIRRPDDRRTLPFRGRGHLQRLELGRSRFRTRQPGRTEADAEPDETEIFPSDPRGVQNAAQACAPGGIGGIDPDNIFITDIGEVVEIQNGMARKAGKVTAGNVLIDGLGVGDVGNIVLRDRKLLSQDGILVVVVTLSKQDGTIMSGPDIISRGFVYVRESEGLLDEANRIVSSTLQKLMSENVNEWASLKTGVKDALGRFLYEQTRRRPMILPIIMEV